MTNARRSLLAAGIIVALVGAAAAQLQAQRAGARPAASGWRVAFDASGSMPVIVDGVLYVGSVDGVVQAIDAATGAVKWRFQTGETGTATCSS